MFSEQACPEVEVARDSIRPATEIRRRGPSLSRRIGQTGNVFQHGHKGWNPSAPAYGRFWIDILSGAPESISLGICPTRSIAKQKLREHIDPRVSTAKKHSHQHRTGNYVSRPSGKWIESLSTRRRKPVKPANLGLAARLGKWIFPNLGDMQLAEVANAAVKELIEKMASAGLSAKTIVNYTKVVKMVVASAVNEEGEEITLASGTTTSSGCQS